ncbi:D-alanine--D-alanine ligase family protein [Stomatohabitans albus]|uniref:D-alanine--D-alanine ligase family protein n=1 Tax=Stomatohabitans albus TaxID=3110766 RepID=UPI00300C1928
MRTSPANNVVVIFGGRSEEHPVSCWSARNVANGLKQAGYTVSYVGITRQGEFRRLEDVPSKENPRVTTEDGEPFKPYQLAEFDLAFPVLHGPYGEDGSIQGLFATLNIPYVGCSVASSAVAMDKYLLKEICASIDIPQTPFIVVHEVELAADEQAVIDEITKTFDYPLFIKPVRQGSSIGISRVTTEAQLREGLALARSLDRTIIVEPAVSRFREIECAVLGLDDPFVSVPGEIKKDADAWYDFESKYTKPAEVSYTADVDQSVIDATQQLTKKLWAAVGMRGLARFDYFLLDDGQVLLNEVNTMPGFTPTSLYPKMIEASGIELPDLVDRLVKCALEVADDESWPA